MAMNHGSRENPLTALARCFPGQSYPTCNPIFGFFVHCSKLLHEGLADDAADNSFAVPEENLR
jgi:hypothetical protein